MMQKITSLFLILLLAVSTVNAEVQLEKLLVSTPNYYGETRNFRPELGTYEYEVSWSGISAANVFLTVNKSGANYDISTKVKTYSGVDIFYKLRYEAAGKISGVDFSPIESTIHQQENSRVKSTSLKFTPEGRVRSSHQYKTKIRTFDFNPNNPMLDPFSAAFLARSLDWEIGQTRYFDTFNGKSRYLISFSATDKIKMDVNGETRDVWVIEPSVKKLNTDKQKNKLRSAKMYVTADEKREILEIDSEVFVGSVKTRLVGFTPSKGQQSVAVNYNFQ